MTKLDFISGMKRLSSYYFKELTNDQLEAWYEMFKNVRVEDFNIAIKLISKENEYMPTAQMLYKKCSQAYKEFLIEIAKYMMEDGYFYLGVQRLDEKQAKRNLDKTIDWIEKSGMPEFLREDFEYYIKKYKKHQLDYIERLKLQC
jgi:hypothetical protein